MPKGDYQDDCDKPGVSGHPDWLNPILDFMDVNISRIDSGALVLARRVFRCVETESEIPEPKVLIGVHGNLQVRWELPDGETLAFNFRPDGNAFRYRHVRKGRDTGVIVIDGDWADNIRCIFRSVFQTNNVNKQQMEYHLGRRFS
jgi:hypothetical protein